ncbi:hypothetical protein FD977_02820 [Polynucleobacter sp. AP-Elch-400A-B2]|uniref:hypothetical protein n=1 Tax=Polynucleobacter sp. AP-Elch-400A-B2 TaxID=2576930 RepID=UPI001BFE42F9|nr:hypothetical protein [Polynucleobacter sp. AP-Elch-400A-B2]QWE25212.1 hypothetical protein FD977_02820 [Polynucleobacter sp. AP-Elch-400A-B2]
MNQKSFSEYDSKLKKTPILEKETQSNWFEFVSPPQTNHILKPEEATLGPENILVMPNGDRYWRMLEKDLIKYQGLSQELADLRGRIYALTEIVAQVELKVNQAAISPQETRRRRSAERILLWIRSTLLPF